jgi:alpha-D-ribose 1-methylphosphonate 5-phosphate C-P lyase
VTLRRHSGRDGQHHPVAGEKRDAIFHRPTPGRHVQCNGPQHRRPRGEATIIQTRHRIPEQPLTEGQILVFQVPIPEPLRFLEPRETETRKMHELEEYGLMHIKLYEDIARHGQIATSYAYPVKVEGRYVMDPSPIPKFDNPKLNGSAALMLFGAGREQRIYALPPHSQAISLDFEDHPFQASKADHACTLCGSDTSYLDEVITDDRGGRMFVCSDTDFCRGRREATR